MVYEIEVNCSLLVYCGRWSGRVVEPEKIAALTKAFDAFCRQNV